MYWLSFCDPEKPKGSQFLGVAVVEADDCISAIMLAHMLGINPGGEVLGVEIPDDEVDIAQRNRLLSLNDMKALGWRLDTP